MAPGARIGKGSGRYLQILEARMAVRGEQDKYPEFAGNVLAVWILAVSGEASRSLRVARGITTTEMPEPICWSAIPLAVGWSR